MAPSPCPALQQWGSSDGAGETPPSLAVPSQSPPSPALPLPEAVGAQLGFGTRVAPRAPSLPQPCNDSTGGENCSLAGNWGATGMSWGWGGGGVTAHTRGMWGKEGLRGAEPHPWLLDQLCPGGLGSVDAAPLMFWGISWDLPSLTATGTLSHSNKDLYPGWWLLDKCLGTASLAAASQGQLMWALGAKNNGPPRLPQLVSVRRKRWCWW